MGNKRAREFQKRALIEAEWTRARTDERSFFQDVSAFGIGLRRLTVIHCPSFQQGYAWDVRELEGRLRLFRSRVCSRSVKLTGYDQLHFESEALQTYLARFRAVKIALNPIGVCGFDGTTIHLGIFSLGSAGIRLSWWGEPQEEWKEIASITQEMIEQFTAAPLSEPSEVEQGSKRMGEVL